MITTRRAKGMTLPEIIVVSGLFLLIFLCLYGTLLPGIRAWKKSDIKSDLQRNGLIAVKKISEELRGSDIESVRIFPGSYKDEVNMFRADAIAYLSPYGQKEDLEYNLENGRVLWQKHGIIYLDPETRNLYMQENFIIPPTDSPKFYQPGEFTPSPQKDRIIARGIYNLSFQAEYDPQRDEAILQNPILFVIGLEIEEHTTLLESGVSTMHNQE